MSEKSPAFQFYPRDFVADAKVAVMSCGEVGAYIRLICYCWLEEGLPIDKQKLARLAGCTDEEFNSYWETLKGCFTLSDDRKRYEHKRLLEEKAKQVARRDQASDAAKTRWKKARSNAPAMRSVSPSTSPSSAPSTTIPKDL
jgi:uncharacterized protein YdaU (DUF1376 family)